MTPTARADAAASVLFETELGVCALTWRADAVTGLALPEPDPALLRDRLTRRDGAAPLAAAPTGPIGAVVAAITAHLSGELDDLRWVPLDLSGVPAFHREIYRIIREIPPGRTLGYGQIAAVAGAPGAAQAVGRAMGRNPIPLIIPCHRVLAADHGLHGFSAPGGLVTKQRMLAIERTPGFGEPTLF